MASTRTAAIPKRGAILAIVSVLAALAGSIALSFAIAGDTAWNMPLFAGLVLMGCTLAIVVLATREPVYLIAPLACLAFLSFACVTDSEVAFWPGWLLLNMNWQAVAGCVAAWIALIGAALWPLRRTLLASGAMRAVARSTLPWRKAPRVLMLALGIGFWAYLAGNLLWSSFANLGWALASRPAFRSVEVDEKTVTRSSEGEIRIYLETRDGESLAYEALYRREVGTIPDADSAHDAAMQGCWNQDYAKGDILLLEGREGLFGFAADRVVQVTRGKRRLCG